KASKNPRFGSTGHISPLELRVEGTDEKRARRSTMVGRSKLKEWIRAAFVTSLAFVPAFAFATGGDRIPGSRYVSGRGAALGDAYIGLGDTMADGLFYNPAAIGKVGGLVVEPLNISLQANSKLGSMFNQ